MLGLRDCWVTSFANLPVLTFYIPRSLFPISRSTFARSAFHVPILSPLSTNGERINEWGAFLPCPSRDGSFARSHVLRLHVQRSHVPRFLIPPAKTLEVGTRVYRLVRAFRQPGDMAEHDHRRETSRVGRVFHVPRSHVQRSHVPRFLIPPAKTLEVGTRVYRLVRAFRQPGDMAEHDHRRETSRVGRVFHVPRSHVQRSHVPRFLIPPAKTLEVGTRVYRLVRAFRQPGDMAEHDHRT